jgi:hypothetical protein
MPKMDCLLFECFNPLLVPSIEHVDRSLEGWRHNGNFKKGTDAQKDYNIENLKIK